MQQRRPLPSSQGGLRTNICDNAEVQQSPLAAVQQVQHVVLHAQTQLKRTAARAQYLRTPTCTHSVNRLGEHDYRTGLISRCTMSALCSVASRRVTDSTMAAVSK